MLGGERRVVALFGVCLGDLGPRPRLRTVQSEHRDVQAVDIKYRVTRQQLDTPDRCAPPHVPLNLHTGHVSPPPPVPEAVPVFQPNSVIIVVSNDQWCQDSIAEHNMRGNI